MKQQWLIEKDQICCEFNRQLSVGIDGKVTAGARCRVSDNVGNKSWLFDHQ